MAKDAVGQSDLTQIKQTNRLTYSPRNLLTQITSKEVKKLFVFGLPSKLTLSSVASMAWMPSRGRTLKELSAKSSALMEGMGCRTSGMISLRRFPLK